MAESLFYKIALSILLVTFMIFKMHLTNKNQTDEEREGNNYSLNLNIILAIASIGLIFLPIIWIFSNWINFASIIISNNWRIFAILLYMSLILLMIWQMKILDVNISTVRTDQFLVSNGPYRYIRHPLYSIFIGQSIATSLIIANWLLVLFIPIVIIGMLLRIRIEENDLIDEYGEDYVTYMKNTKKLIPKIF